MASINKVPSGKWKARVRAHGVSVSKTFTTRKAAATWAKRKEREFEQDRAYGYAESTLRRLTLGEVCLAYLDQSRAKDRSRSGRVRWWIAELGSLPILEIDKVHVRNALRKYGTAHAVSVAPDKSRHDTGRKHSAASVNRLQAALSAVFQWARHELDVPNNPAREVRMRKEPKGRERFLTRDEAAKLLEACRGSEWDRLYLLVLMALNSGARRGELMGLRWKHIDFEGRTATLYDTKNSESRVLTLSDEVMDELRRHRPGAEKVVNLAQTERMADAYVFYGRHPFIRRAFDGEWRKAQERAGIKPMRFHDLRHTAASWLAQDGASLHEIANVLGHRNLTTTQRYAHFCTESKRRLTDRVLGSIAKGGNGDE